MSLSLSVVAKGLRSKGFSTASISEFLGVPFNSVVEMLEGSTSKPSQTLLCSECGASVDIGETKCHFCECSDLISVSSWNDDSRVFNY